MMLVLDSGFNIREHLPKKKMFTFGHCPNEGGEALARIKKYNIYSFLTAEKDVQVARNGGGTFFFERGVPLREGFKNPSHGNCP